MKNDYEEFIKLYKKLGYTSGFDITKINLEEQRISDYLNGINIDTGMFVSLMKKLELKENAKRCMNNYFNLHDVKINCRTDGFNLKMVCPYNLPVEFIDSDLYDGKLVFEEMNYNLNGKKIYDTVMEKIVLTGRIDGLSLIIYTHELMHTQLEGQREYTTCFLYTELLPKFVEFLIASKLTDGKNTNSCNNLLDVCVSRNLYYLQQLLINLRYVFVIADMLSFCKKDYIIATVYVKSILNALELFDNYISAESDSVRRKIIYGVQDVLDGKITIEELLEENKIGKTPGKRLEIVKKWTR